MRASAAEVLGGAEPGFRAGAPGRTCSTIRSGWCAWQRRGPSAGEPEGRLLPDERGKFTAALEEWIAGQRFSADRPEALTNLGVLQFERRAPQEAMASFRAALERDPTYVQAAVNLADVQRAVGDDASAEQTLRQAIARSPDAASAHFSLGLTLIREGRKAEALAALREAHSLQQGDARLAYVYAVAQHDAGDSAGAIATLRRALKIHPNDQDLSAALGAYEAVDP